MAVRNQHVRQGNAYVLKTINDQKVHFYPYDWNSDKQKCYYAATKAAAGKLTIPTDSETYYGITIVYVKANGELSATEGK